MRFLQYQVERTYWIEKARNLNIDIERMTWEQQLLLGDECLEDYGSKFFLHIPFISEVMEMIDEIEMEVLFAARRLDYSGIEEYEDELDDNYIWVISQK